MVFDALMLRRLDVNNNRLFPDDLEAFRTAFRARRFRILITDRILSEYQQDSERGPQFQVQPVLDNLSRRGRVLYRGESQLTRYPVQLTGFPREHQAFIQDAIAARASYVITRRREWLRLSAQTSGYGLQIVNPRSFVELEG